MRFFMSFDSYRSSKLMSSLIDRQLREQFEEQRMREMTRYLTSTLDQCNEISARPVYDVPRWSINRDEGLNSPRSFINAKSYDE